MVRVIVAAVSLSLLLAAGALAHAPQNARSTTAARAAAPLVEPSILISGRGWGHGVGMSQYGALGAAREGWTYAQILAHYYPGTELGRTDVKQVRVLLVEGRKALKVSSEAAFAVRGSDGVRHELAPGGYSFGPGLRLKLGEGAPQALPGPLLFSPGAAPVAVDGKAYRGSLRVDVVRNSLRAVNVVGLEPYLAGVVPDEVPPTWPGEALKAQAVVARSYALAVRKPGDFDLHDDTRSQVYGGVAAEEPSTTAAVGETAGQILLYDGKVATTFFYSTSGGRTAAIEDVWDGGVPTPYLVAVPDPFDAVSPYHTWGPVTFTAARVTKALKVKGQLVDLRTTLNDSGRVGELIAVGTKGEIRIPGAEVRRLLGLRSTWFSVGMLGLQRFPRPLVFGARAKLTGVARGLQDIVLERRLVTSTAWEPADEVKAAKDGTFALAFRAEASAWYRLGSGEVRSAPVRALVAPGVKLTPPSEPTVLRGVARPILPGATVAIQRRTEGTAWSTVATAQIDDSGGFAAQLELVPGEYRARLAPGRGFAVGFSPVLRVVPA